MIPYELIVPSASRPHLLEPVLQSLFQHVDQRPERVWIHNDAAFPGREQAIHEVVARSVPAEIPWHVHYESPPIYHGPTLAWLLRQATTEYVLYSQDDHIVCRPVPITRCLAVMAAHQLHHVRFNKRATMAVKGSGTQQWAKQEQQFQMSAHLETLTVADHWYFQTSLWRRERIKKVTDWWMENFSGSFREHAEIKINHAMNGRDPHFTPAALLDMPGPRENPMDPDVRARIQRTYIWGPIGEDRYVLHIGDAPKDWALPHARSQNPEGIRAQFPER